MINSRYEYAREVYGKLGVNTDEALKRLKKIKISIHCWQGDDVTGFESGQGLSGGIAATGNYPGKARNLNELMSDLDIALSLIPGKHRLNLHSIYAETGGKIVSRDELKEEHFKRWVDYAKERGLGLDFNPTPFSHKMADDGLTLSHPDKSVRDFWIRHCIATRRIAAYFGKELGDKSLHNIWIPDGLKDTAADRLGPRRLLKESLDEIFADEKVDKSYLYDSVESKLFGIGLESFTVGSHEFYMNYAARNNVLMLLDSGHYHPTEYISDKISSLLLFCDKIALHVTRGVRWDSDHVVTYTDELTDIAREIVRCGEDRVLIGLDYFDASINRIAAWVIGTRNMQRALLYALLTPNAKMMEMQNCRDFTGLMAMNENLKSYPFGDVWEYFLAENNVKSDFLPDIREYEENVLLKRASRLAQA